MKKLLSLTSIASATAALFAVCSVAANAQVGTILPTDVTGITAGGVGPTGVLNSLQEPVYTSNGFGMPASQLYGQVLTQPAVITDWNSGVLTQPAVYGSSYSYATPLIYSSPLDVTTY